MTNNKKEVYDEKIITLLNQLDEYIKMGNDIKQQLETILKMRTSKVVHEKRDGYRVNKKPEMVLMPDYLIDENNNITGLEFTLVKGFGTPT